MYKKLIDKKTEIVGMYVNVVFRSYMKNTHALGSLFIYTTYN